MTDIPAIAPTPTDLLDGKAKALQQSDVADPQQLGEVARQFESIFVSILLKEMRQSVGDEGLFGGDSSDVFGGMFDLYLGEHIAKSTNLGVSDMVTKNLQKYIEARKLEDAQQTNG